MDWENSCNYQREVSYQGRLDKHTERQRIKLRDNLIKHAGIPEDVLVVEVKRNIEGDAVTKVIKDAKISNCIFPVLKDIPVRKKTTEFGEDYTAITLVSAQGEGNEKGQGSEQKDLTTIEVILPMDANINMGDQIIRVMVQDTINSCSVMVFDVIELLADFSNNSPLGIKARVALSTQPVDLTKPAYKMIMAMAKRRLEANY